MAGSGKAEDTKGLTISKSENFSEWYNELVQKAELAEYAPVAGCMIIRPDGYAIWERLMGYFDARLKETGHKNAYFPMFIPERFLKKESEHFDGFTPEVAWIIEEGEKGSKERFALRPTSETIINDSFSKWIRSWRDLPMLINQWVNIVRWETTATRLFLRTREFLWQEGHTAHATEKEADEEARLILKLYKDLMEGQLAIPIIIGDKTPKERFPGAINTYTTEALMDDGRALQMGTSHCLGQNFAKAFNIRFRDKDEKEKLVWQTSWGISTRLIGALVMVHGDDRGLVLPPNIAPVQAVVVPIIFDKDKEKVTRAADSAAKDLCKSLRAESDLREEYSAGWKFNHWEMKGVPLRVEIGPKDIEKGQAVLVRRDTGKKSAVPIKELRPEAEKMLSTIQKDMFNRAKKSLLDRIVTAKGFKEIEAAIKARKMVKTEICDSPKCEDAIQERTAATVRLIEEGVKPAGKCAVCSSKAKYVVFVAKQY